MADATSATFFCAVRNASGGDRDVKLTWSLPVPILFEQDFVLTQNTTTSLSGWDTTATLLLIIPPVTNTQQIRIDDSAGKKLTKSIPVLFGIEGDSTAVLHLASGSNQTVHVVAI